MYGLGKAQSGEMGTGKKDTEHISPTILLKLKPFVIEQIACGRMHSICVTTTGDVFISLFFLIARCSVGEVEAMES